MTNEENIEILEGIKELCITNAERKAIDASIDALQCLSVDHSVYGIVLQYGYNSAKKDLNHILNNKNLKLEGLEGKLKKVYEWINNNGGIE